MATDQPETPRPRWYRLTPGRFLVALLVVEALLWLSERFKWLPWHKGYAVLTTVAVVAAAVVLMLLWFVASLIFRWRFQFSIRSLLALTVAVALPFGWLAAEMRKAERQRQVAAEVRGTGGWIASATDPSGLSGCRHTPSAGSQATASPGRRKRGHHQ